MEAAARRLMRALARHRPWLPGLAALLIAACVAPEGEPPRPPRLASLTAAEGADWKARLPTFPRFDAGELVESWRTEGGRFALHFTRQGRNQVLLADSEADGLPDLVQAVAATLEAAQSEYVDRLGFRPPVTTLDGDRARTALDVFLVDFAGRGDGAFIEEGCRPGAPRVCQGLLLLENDFAGYRYGDPAEGARTVASHELFHAVQAAYDRPDNPVLAEGTATWATEAFDPDLTDFERAVPGYLASPDQPLQVAPVGPVPAFAYGAALFFQFLSERHGPGLVAALYQALERPAKAPPPAPDTVNPTPWVPALAALLEQGHGTPFPEAFAEFARWNATSGTTSPDPGFRHRADYAKVAARTLTLPASLPLRLFSASAQHFIIATPPAGPLKVALLPELAGAPLEVAAFAQQGDVRTFLGRAPRELDLSPPPGTTALHLVVSHGAPSGAAVRPTLCIGSEAELAACRAAVPAPSAAAVGMDAGGCVVSPGAPGRGGMPVVMVLAAVALVLRRRRKPARILG